jgi:hypothetical protein
MPRGWPLANHHDLIDRTTGAISAIRLPDGERWSIVSVCPWRGPAGELEAAGRWIDRASDEFCGWALFRLSDGAVLGRVATEILPIGRPCWVPGRSRTIVFPAGDGRLYWCQLVPGDDEPAVRGRTVYATGRTEPSEPVVWEVPLPGTGEVFLENPVWPQEPRLRRWMFVGLRLQEGRNDRLPFAQSQLWWLEMSDDGRSIVAAGRLTSGDKDGPSRGAIEGGFPNVAVGRDGDSRLVYLERSAREAEWRLRSVALRFDPLTGRPTAAESGQNESTASSEPLRAGPLLVSTNGATVYGLLRSGRLATLPIGRARGAGDQGR